MKQLKLLIVLVGVFVTNSINIMAGQISHTVTYDPAKLSLSYDTINNIYTVVGYDGLLAYNFFGHPKLPTDILTFSVPYNAKNFSVQLSTNSFYDINLRYHVIPQQKSKVLDKIIEHEFTEPDIVAYSSFDFIPSQTSTIISSGYLLGDNQTVSVRINPFTYNPKYKIVRIATNATITLSYDVDTTIVPSLIRYNLDVKDAELANIEQYIANGYYLAYNSYMFSHPNQGPSQNQQTLPTYSYCIITSRELEPAFKKLIAMKRQKGLSAGVICIEDLMDSPICNGGDVNGDGCPLITDTAGVVREYLKYAFQSLTNPTQYVLFGGKSPYAPVRFAKSPNQKWPSWQHVPSDIYFSDLSMKWRHISSDYDIINQCEYEIPNLIFNSNSIPYYPDLFVGRLSCCNQEEIENYSNKLYKYIFKPGNGNCTYLSKALVVSSNDSIIDSNAYNFTNWVGSMINSAEMTMTRVKNKKSNYYTGSQLISYLNENKCGYLSLYGHGEPQSIELFNNDTIRYVLSALDCYVADSLGLTTETTINEIGNGLDCLNSKFNPFICYSISCSTMPYDEDPTFNTFTTYEYKYNMGESFTLGKNYGGPAFLGNTRMGYANASEYFEAEFINTLLTRHIFSPGKSEAFSKIFYKRNNDAIYNHILLEHNLLGDPEFEMWTEEPQQYEGITINRYGSIYIINGITPSDTIAYCDNDGNLGRTYGGDGFDYLVGTSPSTSIMVYNHSHIPYIVPLMLQNCDINNSQYVYASSFSAGNNIIPFYNNGNVTVKNGAVYEVEATDDVHLGEGFVVENGATFAIKTPNKVTIDGCVFQSGANVKIEAGSIEIIKKITAERGAKVEMIHYIE